MAILRKLRAVQRVGRIICFPNWTMLLKRLTAGLQTRISSRGWKSMPREILSWKKMMVFMRRVTFSGAFIIRPVNQCPKKHFWPDFYQFGWRDVWCLLLLETSFSRLSYCRPFVWSMVALLDFLRWWCNVFRPSCIDGGFLQTTDNEEGKGTIIPRDGPNPRIGLPYTYLMAWFALHCPVIIQAGEKPPEGVRVAHLRRFEGSSWS